MAADITEKKLEELKILYREVVAPRLKEWFDFKTIKFEYHDNYNKKRNCEETDVHYASFDHVVTEKDYQGKTYTYKKRLYFIDSKVPAGLSYYVKNELAKLDGLTDQHGYMKNRDLRLEIETTKTITNCSVYGYGALKFIIDQAQARPEFDKLSKEVNFQEILSKAKARRDKQKEYSEKKRAVKFTLSDQKVISNILLNLLIKKTDNYLLKLLDERITADAADQTGEKLAAAMEIYNLDKQDIINELMSSTSTTSRRFAALFADNATVALIDQDKAVRLAAKARQAKKKEKEEANETTEAVHGPAEADI